MMQSAVNTTCPYCGVGCGVVATPDGTGAVEIAGDKNHPANFGRLCSKGSALGQTVSLDDRLLYPEVKGEQASWDEALDLVADRFKQTIEQHGPDSVAFYVSGQILTEDYYVANKLMKGFIGSGNIDTNSRLCMASSVAGHKRAFGSDTVPGNYEDLEQADLLVIVGSNLAWCHPVLYQRIAAAKAGRPSMKIVVVDPRRTVTADIADLHLPINADGDTALFNGLLNHLAYTGNIDNDYVDSFTNGFADALKQAQSVASDIEAATGLSKDLLEEFYNLFDSNTKTVTIYSQGVNQSTTGTDKVNAIINCHLATGRIGKPGMGPFSVTGQPNAMGGREVGGLANMLAAHMDINSADDQALVADFWNAPNIATKPGLKAVDMFDAVADGRIKALWIMSTNPVDSMPNSSAVEAAIASCPFVVVSDVVAQTDTLRYAHVKLPATAWGEKDGTVTNSERRISRQRRFLSTPGDAKPDWWQMAEVAKRMGYAGFDYATPADVYREHAQLSAHKNDGTRDFDIGSTADISDTDYATLTPFQWPSRLNEEPTARLFDRGNFFTSDKKANFIPIKLEVEKPKASTTKLRINTGRVRDHWHTMTRTGRSPRNSAHLAEPFCEINPEDAKARSVTDACIVSVKTDFGTIMLRAMVTSRQPKGSVFVPIHWTDQFASNARVDKLVAPDTDPVSGQPALKASYGDVVVVPMKKFGFVVSTEKPDLDNYDYWAVAKTPTGWRAEFASLTIANDQDQIIPNQKAADVSLGDEQAGNSRSLWFEDNKLSTAIFTANQPVVAARAWACEQHGVEHEIKNRAFIAFGRPGPEQEDKGAIVCSCFGIGANEIAAAIASGCKTVKAVGKACQAGTNCGSCQPEILGFFND